MLKNINKVDSESNRNISLDIFKIFLSILVVLIHADFLNEYSQQASYTLVNGLFRIAVPIFFMINGYFFVIVLKNNKLTDWLKRVGLLYCIWTIIYIPFWYKLNITKILETLIVGYYHLWYIQALLLCGVLFSLLKNIKIKYLIILSISLFFIGSCIQYIGNFNLMENYPTLNKLSKIDYLHRNFIFLGLPFFIIGYLINSGSFEKRLSLKKTILFSLFGILLLFIESNLNFLYTQEKTDNLFSLIIACPFIFLLILNIKILKKIDSKKNSLLSTAIYLVHPWILNIILRKFSFLPTTTAFITIVLTLVVSFTLIKTNKKYRYIL